MAATLVLLALACAAIAAPDAHADTIRVDLDGGGDYLTIQEGIDAASEGDIVLVAPGTYTGSSNTNLDFGGVNLVLRSESGPELTQIDCEHSYGVRGLWFHSGEDSTSVVEGFAVMNGFYDNGGGIRCDSGTSPKLVNCQLVGNWADNGAGLFCNQTSLPAIVGCEFQDNQAGMYVGAVYAMGAGGSQAFVDCTFLDNQAEYLAGNVWGAGLRFTDCVFEGNSCSYLGTSAGAIHLVSGSSLELERCRFRSNSGRRGAVYCPGSCTVSAVECTFYRNSAISGGGGICIGNGSLSLSECTFEENGRYWAPDEAPFGGALSCGGTNIAISDCSFVGNRAERGGGVYLSDCSGTVTACLFARNEVVSTFNTPIGGALYVYASSANVLEIDQCTLSGNSATTGAGMYCGGGYGPTVTQTVIAFGLEGRAVSCADGTSPTVTQCCVFGNAAGDSLCGMYYDNIFEDPLFCDREGDDYTIEDVSPCAPGNNAYGVLIGAYGVGCGGTAVEPKSWSAIKAMYR